MVLPTAQPNKHSNKRQCRYELQISAKVKSNKNLLPFVSCSKTVNQLTSIVYHLWLLQMYNTNFYQWLKWSCEGGAHLTKPDWNKPHTHSTPN